MARASAKHRVQVGILGEGASSRHARRAHVSDADLEDLRTDARAAAEIVGARDVLFGGLPDNRFDEVALLDIVKVVERWVERCEPDIIYTHHPADLNVDHGLTCRAVLTSTRPGTLNKPVREILAFEIPSSTEWAFHGLGPSFQPSVFVDISATIDRKVAAMQCYHSESRPAPHPRSPEALRALATWRGATAGVPFAEAFALIRALR